MFLCWLSLGLAQWCSLNEREFPLLCDSCRGRKPIGLSYCANADQGWFGDYRLLQRIPSRRKKIVERLERRGSAWENRIVPPPWRIPRSHCLTIMSFFHRRSNPSIPPIQRILFTFQVFKHVPILHHILQLWLPRRHWLGLLSPVHIQGQPLRSSRRSLFLRIVGTVSGVPGESWSSCEASGWPWGD